MKVTIFHKGLVIVAVPLVVELLMIGPLYYLLHRSDGEYAIQSQRYERSVLTARIVFADCTAGALLKQAWVMRDISRLEEFRRTFKMVEALNVMAHAMPLDPEPGLRALLVQYQKAQDEFIPVLKKIGEASSEGFTFSALRKVLAYQKVLNDDLKSCFTAMRQGMVTYEEELATGWKHLQVMRQFELAIVAVGFILNLFAALWIGRFFQRNFIAPIRTIRENTTLLANKAGLHEELGGTDEIADLDRAFHSMSRELAATAEREQALFDNSSDVLCTIAENNIIARINKAAEEMWGRHPDSLIGRKLSEIIPSSDFGRAASALETSRSTGRAANFETDMEKADGTVFHMIWSAYWSERLRSWYCTVHDITERRKLERLKESFLQLIAADFRIPLGRISEYFTALACGSYGALPETVSKRVDNAIQTLKRLVLLVDELLHLEQLQSRELRLERKKCSVRELLEQSINDVREIARARRIEIAIESGDLDWFVDDRSMVRVVVNLLSNAIKFSPEGGEIKVEVVSEPKLVRVAVRDQGRGIPADVLARLFQPFQQAQAADGKRGKGTGLGLVICKRIVEQHGGEIGVESKENEGSTFWFAVPAEDNLDMPTSAKQSVDSAVLPRIAVNANIQAADAKPVADKRRSGGGTLDLKRKSWILISVPLFFEMVFVLGMLWLLIQSGSELSKQLYQRDLILSSLHMPLPGYELALGLSTSGTNAEYAQLCEQTIRDIDGYRSEFERAVGKEAAFARFEHFVLIGAHQLEVFAYHVHDYLVHAASEVAGQKSSDVSYQVFQMASLVGSNVEALVEVCSREERLSPEKLAVIRGQQANLLSGGLILNVLTALALALFFSVDVVSRLRVLSDNSRRLSAGQPLNEPVTGRDEIAELDAAFHEMARRLMEAREKERAFLDNSLDIICAVDADGRFTAVNRAADDVLGVSPATLLKSSLSQFVVAEQAQNVRERLDAVRASGRPGSFDTVLSRAGEPLDVLWSVSWSPIEASYFCVVHDISHRKELERIKREFLAVISHDLRSPLTTIAGMVGLAQSQAFGELPEKAADILKGIGKESDQILELVDDLLDLEKLEAGQMQLKLVNADLRDILEKAWDSTDRDQFPSLPQSAMTSELVVNADSDRLAQAFSNILMEALKVSPFRTKVDIFLEDASIKVIFSSNGSMAGPAVISGVIARLNAVDTGQEGESGGSRLRLPLAKRILQSHQGDLAARMTEGGDLIFEIHLPRAL